MEKHTARLGQMVLRLVVLTAVAGLLVFVFRRIIPVNQTTVALSFLMLVLLTASRWRLVYSVYLSVLCTLLYNFYFLPPVGRFTISDPRNWIALGAFLCSSVLVSHLSDREHRHAEASEARRREVELLYEFSQQLLLQEDLRGLARATPSIAASAFGFSAVALYVRNEDATYFSDPGNELLSTVDLKLAAIQTETGITESNGVRIIPFSLGMRSPGALAVAGGNFSTQIYEAIGSLVAIAIERAAAVERSSRLEAWREGERLRSALLDSITHDLRTPLTAIRAAATMLVSEPDLAEPARTELAVVLDEESARLNRLIGQAVEMAQLDAAAVQLNPLPQDVHDLIETAVDEMRALLRDHPVEIEIPPDLPRVLLDRALVHRVLRHIIENAARYSPPGAPISITARRDDYRLLITVADQGPGIDLTEQPFVFDKFFRGRKQQAQSTGTGMGLAIAKAIVEAHGGGIELASRAGQGTRFTFWLPLVASS
jgi:two-component system sensor histidine kinase KdpD